MLAFAAFSGQADTLAAHTPYSDLPPRAFWRTGAGTLAAEDIRQLSDCKQKLTRDLKVATAGSCFAQHISRRLRAMGYNFMDAEPAPPWMTPAAQRDFGYGVYSARYGNIYTSRQLKLLLKEAFGDFTPEERVWRNGDRYFDPFRPTIEPNGFESADEVLQARESLLLAVRRLTKAADVFVFTFGLTECWLSKSDGAAYPICPGVHAGEFDPDKYEFANLTFADVLADMTYVIQRLRKRRPTLRFIFTVSPVPLTATAAGGHVLTATTHSKAILRAVAGQLQATYDFVDYFPSYELVTAPSFGGRFYAPNKREVTEAGVATVMNMFEREFCEGAVAGEVAPTPPEPAAPAPSSEGDVICDERILEHYATR